MSVRVRFAPSPTGYLHIGGARTALFNWLYARHTGGTFVLRIEDTDAARNTREAVQVILDGLRWLGLTWDEGPLNADPAEEGKGPYGPYFQSRRKGVYDRWRDVLLSKNLAYEQDGAVKFRMDREPVLIRDCVVGDVTRELTDREALDPDFVIVRSDGAPVFHFVNVVDDLEMRITHVIRGEDHLSNTAKHIALFRALGAEPPQYAHIPLILNPDGSKMSKRDTGASLSAYQEKGYLPEAVVNFLCLLGWSPKDDRQLLPLDEVVERFDLSQILRHNARFDFPKLDWLNFEYLRHAPQERFVKGCQEALVRAGVDLSRFSTEYVHSVILTCKDKLKVFSDILEYAGFYFQDRLVMDPALVGGPDALQGVPRVAALRLKLADLPVFQADPIQVCFKATAAELGVKVGVLVHPVRWATTGKANGPSLYHLMEVLGRERVLARLDAWSNCVGAGMPST